MIRGYVNDAQNAIVEFTVSGLRGSDVLEGCIDTEFDGDVSLPFEVAATLGLDLFGRVHIELANGQIEREYTFLGVASIGGESREVEILVSDSDEALVGRTWLYDGSIYINYVTREVIIEEEVEPTP
jgi:predicted aspartyl protease